MRHFVGEVLRGNAVDARGGGLCGRERLTPVRALASDCARRRQPTLSTTRPGATRWMSIANGGDPRPDLTGSASVGGRCLEKGLRRRATRSAWCLPAGGQGRESPVAAQAVRRRDGASAPEANRAGRRDAPVAGADGRGRSFTSARALVATNVPPVPLDSKNSGERTDHVLPTLTQMALDGGAVPG
jgi:hypothetical protein